NSEWFLKMDFEDVLRLMAKYTVARLLERDDFSNRFKQGRPIGVHELMYPLMQAYDSVALHADIELGGTDQKFNLLVGRDIQRSYGQEPQVILTVPIIEGLDGVQKMSKSLNNYVGVNESPFDMFGKLMSIPDALMEKYFILLTDVPEPEIKSMVAEMESGKLNPRDAKARLAREIVSFFHSRSAAKEAEERFNKMFREKEVPEDTPVFDISCGGEMPVVDLVVKVGFASSKSEARRLISQGGVSIDGRRVVDITKKVKSPNEFVLKVGKRRIVKIKLGG
ncbi:MAG: tyrosine--tRNA ligase, partial [Synergistetes bacterium]|nr:tyrosine--tRNA ligase [Synergistota bacterium]